MGNTISRQLQNYQEALMKIYWDAGLKDIASKINVDIEEKLSLIWENALISVSLFLSSVGISLLTHVHHLH